MKNNYKNNFYWLYLIGFFLILFLPLLELPPWFSPPDWGKTIVFRIILSIMIFVFLWQIIIQRNIEFLAKIKNTLLPIKKSIFSKKIALWLLIALFLVFFLATLFSQNISHSIFGTPFRSEGFLNFAFYIIFAFLAFLIIKRESWQKIWNLAVITGILVSIVAIFQQFRILPQIFIYFTARPPGTIGGPIFLAIYLLLLIFLTLCFGIKAKGIKRIFYFSSILLFIYIIAITLTRAAYLGLIIGALWFLLVYPKKLILLKACIVLFLILGIYGIYHLNTQPFPQFIQENRILQGMAQRVSVERVRVDPRISGWKVGYQAALSRPFLGYGPENFAIGFDKYYDASLPGISKIQGSWWDRAHNFPLEIAVTAGIPGLIIFLSLFVVLFSQLQKLKNKDPSQSLICHGIQASFLAYFAANFFSFDTFSSYIILFFLIAFALQLILSSNNEKIIDNKQSGRIDSSIFYRGLIISVLFVVLIWFIVWLNLKPMQINKQINLAIHESEQNYCENSLNRMENILLSQTFLNNYLRLKYIEVIHKCFDEKKPELNLALINKAREILKENVKYQPIHTRNSFFLGQFTNLLIERKDQEQDIKGLIKEANYYFNKAHQLSPQRQEILSNWIKTDLLAKEFQKAKEKAKKCIDLNPQTAGECYWLLGLSYISLNNLEQAQEKIDMAKNMGYPIHSRTSLLQLVKIYSDIGYFSPLVEIYQSLIRIEPNNVQFHASLAVVYRELGEYQKAKEQAMKILEFMPEAKPDIEKFLKTLP